MQDQWKSDDMTMEQRWELYEEAMTKTDEHVAVLNKALQELEGMIHCEDYCSEGGFSYDDIDLWARLRSLSLVKGLEFPEKVLAYMKSLEKVRGPVHLWCLHPPSPQSEEGRAHSQRTKLISWCPLDRWAMSRSTSTWPSELASSHIRTSVWLVGPGAAHQGEERPPPPPPGRRARRPRRPAPSSGAGGYKPSTAGGGGRGRPPPPPPPQTRIPRMCGAG